MTPLSVCRWNQYNMRYTNGGLREELLAVVGVSGDQAHSLRATEFLWFKKNGHFNAIWIILRFFAFRAI